MKLNLLFFVIGVPAFVLGLLVIGEGGIMGFLGVVLLISGGFLVGVSVYLIYNDLKAEIRSFDPKTHVSAKKERMAEFYRQCQQKGYADMHDDTQSLKAKVIASDLGLRYGNIAAFYQKAGKCYEEVQGKDAIRLEKQAKAQEEARAEAERRAVNGELLLSIKIEGRKAPAKVYIRPDKTIYHTFGNGGKIEGAPRISVKKYESASFTYHPAKATYTGATVGGITTGGVSVTPAGYSSRNMNTGRGVIQIELGTQAADIKSATPSPYVKKRFKRDAEFNRYISGNQIMCVSDVNDSSMAGVASSALPMDMKMNMASSLMANQYFPMDTCREIVSLLERIMRGSFPPEDEDYYERACKLLSAEDTVSLAQAKALFEKISDYKDSAQKALAAQKKYQEAQQSEKEQAILEKERRRKKNRVLYIAVALLVMLAAAAGTVIYTVILPARSRAAYRDVLSSVAVGDTFFFGQYEQDGNDANGPEPLEWQVLEVSDGDLLAISRYLIDSQQFYADSEKYPDLGWKKSALRAWLNSAFYEAAFSADERPLIEKCNTSEGEKAVMDKAFLLSYSEYKKYIGAEPCEPTVFAKKAAELAYNKRKLSSTSWWLRTSILDRSDVYAVSINSGETLKKSGVKFNSYGTDYGYPGYVRPAIWIDVSWIKAE